MKQRIRRAFSVLLGLAVLFLAVPVQGAAVNNGVAAACATDAVEGWPKGPEIISETAVLLDADTGAVLYDKGKDDIRYPASITKLMTVLLAVENCSLDEQVTFTETGVRDVTPDSGNIGMQVGEVMSVKDCLYAALIRSANEVCAQIAEYVGGTEEHFIEMMNARAAELGCQNTHFVNASGLPDENHYSTAYDMALIMQAGLRNETFREIIRVVTYNIPATNMSGVRGLHTHIPLLAAEAPLYYPDSIGGKSGYTSAALNTLVVAAARGTSTYIAVALRAADMDKSSIDCAALWDYGFANFEKLETEGGAVTVPKGMGLDALEAREAEAGGEEATEFYYKGQFMGRLTGAAAGDGRNQEAGDEASQGTEDGAGEKVEAPDGADSKAGDSDSTGNENSDGVGSKAGNSGDVGDETGNSDGMRTGAGNSDGAGNGSGNPNNAGSEGGDPDSAESGTAGEESGGLSQLSKLLLVVMGAMVLLLFVLLVVLHMKNKKRYHKAERR